MDDDLPSYEDNQREMRRIAAQEARKIYGEEFLKSIYSGPLEGLWPTE
jgi:hypothetical protein